MNTAAWDIQDHSAQKGVPGGQGVVEGNDIPYQPWALAKKKENYEQRATLDPETKCYLPGVPRIMYMPFPFQIIQKPNELTLLYEYVHAVRYIFTNGAPHPPGQIEWWLGDSRGRWEGDTLVVDVIHFNDQTWFDRAGNFHSDALHLTERYTLIDPDHIRYAVTVEDPKVFTRPWNMSMILYRHKETNFQLLRLRMLCIRLRETLSVSGNRSSQMRTERLIVAFGIGAALLSAAVPVVGQGQEGAGKSGCRSTGHGRRRAWQMASQTCKASGLPPDAGSVSLTNPISGEADFERAGDRRRRAPSPAGSSILPMASFRISRGRPRDRSSRRPITTARRNPSTSTRSTGAWSPAFRGCTRSFRRSRSFSLLDRSCSSGMNIMRIGSFRSTAGRMSRPT